MNEELLQYIWQMGLFDHESLLSTDNETITIVKRGNINYNSGPDFSNARIRINEADWVGNVEIHIHSDDWYLHNHHLNADYNNTVLHVVMIQGKPTQRQDGSMVPTLIIKDKIIDSVLFQYQKLFKNEQNIPCQYFFPNLDHFTITQTLERALFTRIERKSEQVFKWLKQENEHWQTVLYKSLARSFGFNINGDPFEQLASELPLSVLGKHKNDAIAIESLIFGIAGFLDENNNDDYQKKLKKEWQFYRTKYGLNSMNNKIFKFMQMRPSNFPTYRLAQFSSLIHLSSHLFDRLIEFQKKEDILNLLKVEPQIYWQTHYTFAKETKKMNNELSSMSKNIIVINGVLPVLFAYAKHTGNNDLTQKVLDVLYSLAPEKNKITDFFKTLGLRIPTAFESQALIELKTKNCDQLNCLKCPIGHKVLKSKIET